MQQQRSASLRAPSCLERRASRAAAAASDYTHSRALHLIDRARAHSVGCALSSQRQHHCSRLRLDSSVFVSIAVLSTTLRAQSASLRCCTRASLRDSIRDPGIRSRQYGAYLTCHALGFVAPDTHTLAHTSDRHAVGCCARSRPLSEQRCGQQTSCRSTRPAQHAAARVAAEGMRRRSASRAWARVRETTLRRVHRRRAARSQASMQRHGVTMRPQAAVVAVAVVASSLRSRLRAK